MGKKRNREGNKVWKWTAPVRRETPDFNGFTKVIVMSHKPPPFQMTPPDFLRAFSIT